MKKRIAILLVFVMACSLAMAAGSAEPLVMTWEDVKEQAEQLGGEMIQIKDPSCSIWVPGAFEIKVPEKGDSDPSFRLIAKDEAFSGIEISVSRVQSEAYHNAKEDIMGKILPYAPDLKDCTLNGYPAIIYSRQVSDDDFRAYALIWDEAYPVSIAAFSEKPIENEEFTKLFETMSASYRPE